VKEYEYLRKKRDLEFNDDKVGLLDLEHNGMEGQKQKFANNPLARYGLDTQNKTKESAMRSLQRVGEINEMANNANLALMRQNEQILRLNTDVKRLESTT